MSYGYDSYQPQQQAQPSLDFYSPNPSVPSNSSFYAARPSLDGERSNVSGAIGRSSTGNNYGEVGIGNEVVEGWLNAFGTGGIEGEMPLLEVLNPLSTVDANIMDDADLAGPLVFCSVFAMLLLLSGKPQFSYIYGVGLLGSTSIYCLLNLMSESGIDAYRTTSVLGYCLLPLVLLSVVSVAVSLDGTLGYVLSALTIVWCSYSASSIFTSVLRLSSQKFLVAYPVGLLYAAFALLSVFDGKM